MTKSNEHSWNFDHIGGATRVKITTGADIAHLDELDPKMWTVLSCPTVGLDIDEKSLKYMDHDGDGKIRVNDVVATAKWVTNALNDVDLLLEGKDHLDVGCFNQGDVLGKRLYNSSKQILANLGKTTTSISLADTADRAAIFAQTRFNGDGIITEFSTDDPSEKAVIAAAIASVGSVVDRSGEMGVNAEHIEKFYQALIDYKAWQADAVEAPYGKDTDQAIELYQALDAKVKDYFVRAKLASFSPESIAKLDVQISLIESISADDLTEKTAEIAAYPLARISGEDKFDIDGPINPAWASRFAALMDIVKPQEKILTEEMWTTIGASFVAYSAWKAAKKGAEVEALGVEVIDKLLAEDKKQALFDLIEKDAALREEAENMEMVDQFLHVYKDFYRLLRNFITLNDFYDKDKKVNAIFQSGRLIIDQRECRLCMKVVDMAKHNVSAATSGMFLIYCDCTTQSKPGKLTIVAAITTGQVGDFFVGKNAIYYDNAGLEWDAVITKIIANPISIGQAFWSPYRRMATAIENLINKSAADKDAAIMKNANTKINTAPNATPAANDAKTPVQPFDIGKFAGIFAAIGMALGMIGTFLTSLFKGIFELQWWQLAAAFIGILLLISGPSMVMAWMKLRRRNIAPLLNANGWAVNAVSRVSIPFGETLTDVAKFPEMKWKDPYAKKGMSTWKRWFVAWILLVVIVVALWLFNVLACMEYPSPLHCFHEGIEETVEIQTPASENSK